MFKKRAEIFLPIPLNSGRIPNKEVSYIIMTKKEPKLFEYLPIQENFKQQQKKEFFPQKTIDLCMVSAKKD